MCYLTWVFLFIYYNFYLFYEYLFIYLFLARLTLASSKLNLCVKLMAKLPPECPCKEMHFIGGLHSLSTNKVNMMLSLYLGFILCQTVNNGYLFVYSDYNLLYIKKSEDYISFSAKQTLVCVCLYRPVCQFACRCTCVSFIVPDRSSCRDHQNIPSTAFLIATNQWWALAVQW